MSVETLINIRLIALGMVLVAFNSRVALAVNQALYGEALLPFREFVFRMTILVMGLCWLSPECNTYSFRDRSKTTPRSV